MVSNEEIRRKLEAKRKGIPLKEENLEVAKNKTKTCPQCGTENYEETKFCVGCGKSFKEIEVHIQPKDIKDNANNKICPACKSEIPENVKFCTNCGEKLADTDELPEKEINAPLEESLQKEAVEPLEKAAELEEPVQKEIIEPLTGSEDLPLKLTIEELALDEEGLSLNKMGTIEGWNDEINVVKYEDMEDVKFEESSGLGTVEITVENGVIKIKDIEPNLGNQFTAVAQSKIMQIRSAAEKTAEYTDKIKKAEELLDIGAITQDEFENIKKKILSS